MKAMKNILFYQIGMNILFGIIGTVCILTIPSLEIGFLGMGIGIIILYFLCRKKLDDSIVQLNGLIFFIEFLLFTLFMVFTKGSINGGTFVYYGFTLFPFFLFILLGALMGNMGSIYIGLLAVLGLEAILPILYLRKWNVFKKRIVYILCICIMIPFNLYFYSNRDEVKYGGHGFEYMQGYSSTDFSDYMVYNPKQLVTLDEPSYYMIENVEEMPVLDGAEACYPLYASVAKEVYKDIGQIELDYKNSIKGEYISNNGKIVQFSNTVTGFYRLIDSFVDVLFGARPSKDQLQMAKDMDVEVEVTPIGKEAFIFFVDKDNPIDSLSSKDIQAIYHGDIKNWKELGGKDQEILAFQRPHNSGSQTMMEYFMGDVSLKEPKTYEQFDSMSGVIKQVAQYHNEKGAMGYSFRYFVEELNQESNVKVLKIDGIEPTLENIENGTYPLCVDLCAMYVKGNTKAEKLVEFMVSKQGQELVGKVGYGKLYE